MKRGQPTLSECWGSASLPKKKKTQTAESSFRDYSHGPTVSDHSEKTHWSGYPARRQEKLDRIKPDPLYAGLVDENTRKLTLFSNCTMYFNGRCEELSAFHLSKVVRALGGKVTPFLSIEKVTHVICENLCGSKVDFFRNRKLAHVSLHFVRSSWILDSIKAQRRLPERDYVIEQMKTRQGGALDAFMISKRE